jgi:hypothetical protein
LPPQPPGKTHKTGTQKKKKKKKKKKKQLHPES